MRNTVPKLSYSHTSEINGMSGKISEKDQRILCMRSYCTCAIPTCRKELIVAKTEHDTESNIGEMAHIKGEKLGSARYDENMDEKDRNKHDNLILLCSTCHKTIDDQPGEYTIEKLHSIKFAHEKWASQIIRQEISNITFAELEVITKYLASNNVGYVENYQITGHIEKIKKNQLSETVSGLIGMGMTKVTLVREYIDNSYDNDFGERLRDGFVNEYTRLKNDEKLQGDDMFYSLLVFAGGMVSDIVRSSASLAVLVYFFESCEVFEK